jgi:putative endonuclease
VTAGFTPRDSADLRIFRRQTIIVPQSVSAKMQKKELGKRGEEIAIRFLKKKGYRILIRNYVCKLGEMDIIAREKDTLAFIEVKTRTSTTFGPPQLAVNSTKQMQLSKVALYFLKEKKLEEVKARFDVVAILLGPKGEEIELIKDAFDLKWL